MASIEGKVFALTGAALGIGLATSKILAGRGAILSLADKQQEPLEAAANEIFKGGTKVMMTVLDMRKKEEVEVWIQDTVSRVPVMVTNETTYRCSNDKQRDSHVNRSRKEFFAWPVSI